MVSRPMVQMLDDLTVIADLFARSFFLIVEDIPEVFSNALQACGHRRESTVLSDDAEDSTEDKETDEHELLVTPKPSKASNAVSSVALPPLVPQPPTADKDKPNGKHANNYSGKSRTFNINGSSGRSTASTAASSTSQSTSSSSRDPPPHLRATAYN